MDNFKLTFDVKNANSYENAKKDLLQAKSSFEKLTEKEQQKLIGELFDVEIVERLTKMYRG